MTIVGIIGLVLTIAIGLWKFFKGKDAYRRKLAEEADKELDDAQKNKSASGRINAWGKSRRMQ